MQRVTSTASKERINAQKEAAYAVRKGYTNKPANDIIIAKVRTTGDFNETAKIHFIPTPVNVDAVVFNDTHINQKRAHNVTGFQANSSIIEEMKKNALLG